MKLHFSLQLTHVALLGIFLLSAARVSPDPDTWWHLNVGKWMVEHGELLRVDHFSYTRLGQPYPAPGWTVQLLLYLVYQVGGIGGLNLLTGFVRAEYLYERTPDGVVQALEQLACHRTPPLKPRRRAAP